jgi:hypothetical protein
VQSTFRQRSRVGAVGIAIRYGLDARWWQEMPRSCSRPAAHPPFSITGTGDLQPEDWVKAAEAWRPPTSITSAEVKERLQLYLLVPSVPQPARYRETLVFFFGGAATQREPRPPHSWGFKITHDDAPQSVGLLWTSDQLVAETYTRPHTTLTRDRPPCHRRDSNPQFRQASGHRDLHFRFYMSLKHFNKVPYKTVSHSN